MRKLPMLAAALATFAATPAIAQTSRCYVEAGLAGTFLAAGDRHAQGSVGGGCDLTLSRDLFIGAALRADLGDTSAAVATARLGYNLNPHLALYGIAGWANPEFKIDRKIGQFVVGAGAEIVVGAVPGLSLFGEAHVAAAQVGNASTEDMTIRTGLRWRF